MSNIINDSIKEQILDEVYEELLEKGWSEDSAAEMAPDIAQKDGRIMMPTYNFLIKCTECDGQGEYETSMNPDSLFIRVKTVKKVGVK